jgi:ABC-type dipeptide/oligopeptide/nickel transport system permease component
MMAAYLARRVLESVLILLGITLVTFFLLYVLPADPVRQIAGRSATTETVESIRRQLGLDQPFWVQYGRYLWNLLHLDLGRSYLQRAEVSELIWARLPATLLLMAGGIAFELALGLTMGIWAALRRGTATDNGLMIASFVGVSAPQFVVGLLLLYVFAVQLRWFPIGGYGTWAHLVLPAATLAILGAGWYSRMMRSSMVEVLRQDFIRTARAKGLTRRRIVLRHALPTRSCGRGHDRHRHRGVHGGRRGGGIRVRLARHRPAGLPGDPARRHPHHHGRHAGLGPLHRGGKPARRPHRPDDRPPHQIALTNQGDPRMRTLLASTALLAALALPAAAQEAMPDPYAPDPAATPGGSITITYKDDVATLDPAIGYDWQNWSMIKSLFDGLMDYVPGTTELRPGLAQSYEISDDGLTYTFKLRPGVTFHNGREMTAEDVKYSLDRVTDPETLSPGAGFFGAIAGLRRGHGRRGRGAVGRDRVDPQTVQVTLSRPDATFLHVMALNFASVVPREAVEEFGPDFGRNPVGTGAFRLGRMDHRPAARLREEPRPLARGGALSRPDHLRGGPGAGGGAPAAPDGEVDLPGDGIPPAKFQEVMADPARPSACAGRPAPHRLHHHERAPAALRHPASRQAVNMAIKKDRVVQIINGPRGAGEPAAASLRCPGYTEGYEGYATTPKGQGSPRPRRGFADGFETELFVMNTDPNPRIAQAIQQDLAAWASTPHPVARARPT